MPQGRGPSKCLLSPTSFLYAVLLALARSGDASPSADSGVHQAAQAHHKNWVVITTINYPTDTIKALATVPEWKVVVVADKKTPTDWILDNVIILSVEEQSSMRFQSMSLLPYNHYGRKNIGYLYAILHGANIIYETDDDNQLIVTNSAVMIPALNRMEYIVYNASGLCNPYQHFGFNGIWPRGYPLEKIKDPACTAFQHAKVQPLILQGLANLDPDVDAIYRLTGPLNVHFRIDVPSVVLPEKVWCPWNSQNTLFAHDALWGLLIPVTTTFRVCDIWRSYWVQRLLWEIGGNVAFGPPTVEQLRNPHNLLRDFEDELPLYTQAGKLVDVLTAWVPPAGSNLPQCMIALAQKLADEDMWEQGDVDLMSAWVADLTSIGYKFPPLKGHADKASHTSGDISITPSSTTQEEGRVPAKPHTPRQWQRYNSIIAVIMFNSLYPGWEETYALLKEAYTPLFGKLVFTGHPPDGLPPGDNWASCSAGGYLQYMCFANVLQEFPAPPDGGHLILGDDTIINHCHIHHFNTSKIWFPRSVSGIYENLSGWVEAKTAQGQFDDVFYPFRDGMPKRAESAMGYFVSGFTINRKFADRIHTKLGHNLSEAHFGAEYTDALYIPARLTIDFLLVASAFAEKMVHHEVAIPSIFGIISQDETDFEVFRTIYLWESRAAVHQHPEKFLTSDGLAGQAFMLHPYKFTTSHGDAKRVFWAWWTEGSCAHRAGPDKEWQGVPPIGISTLETIENWEESRWSGAEAKPTD